MLYKCSSTLRSYAATAENRRAERGEGGQANNGRKGSACINPFKQGAVHTLLDAGGKGIVRFGFESAAYFTRCFKKMTQLSPQEFRDLKRP